MSKRHILWADDDMDDLMLMRHVLQDIGQDYDIAEVSNGQEALDYLENAKRKNDLPSLVILDMNMPVLNGKEALSIIKKDSALSEIPLVFFTTSNSELDKMYCKRFGVEMITKPPQYSSLKEAVRKLLNSYLDKA
ncbi:response regulator [Flavisolibacter ginsenosidimutans]|uniref:Response regulator n=1 Tax=Flavisolibacter ginsenosidimutans TaxID=661481 RepID=A0A5B8UD74_9BACT|nr:response regulator [Flavisolibacter ginsenosidimutans]QEC54514.1 response regulator [Flavisolibacter ginsenosidimutans]